MGTDAKKYGYPQISIPGLIPRSRPTESRTLQAYRLDDHVAGVTYRITTTTTQQQAPLLTHVNTITYRIGPRPPSRRRKPP